VLLNYGKRDVFCGDGYFYCDFVFCVDDIVKDRNSINKRVETGLVTNTIIRSLNVSFISGADVSNLRTHV